MEGQDLDKVNAVINFAREAVRAEVMTPTGILNAIWILVVLVLVSVVGLADLYQVVVRTWITDYESGLPSFLWMLLTAGGLTLACIVIVGLFTTGWR